MNLKQRGILFIILIAIIGLSLSKTLVHILTEIWWFDTVGFSEVFWTKLTWQILTSIVTFAFYTLFLWINYQIAMHHTRHSSFRFFEDSTLVDYTDKFANFMALVLILFIGFGAASASTSAWETILKYLHPTSFSEGLRPGGSDRDPIFQQDIDFYVFQLPLYEAIRNWLLFAFVWGLIVSFLVYFLKDSFTLRQRDGRITLNGKAKNHLSLLFAGIAALIAVDFWLKRYSLLYSSNGVVFGAGYTDVHARLFAYSVTSIIALLVAVLLLLSIGRRSSALPMSGIVLFFMALVLLNGVYPWFVQQFIVEPNELTKEKPYIANNIRFTQNAYHLHDVQRQNYTAVSQLNRQVLQSNQPTIRNIRLWDYRPLLSTYRQIQEMRLYYQFQSVDVDRYTLNGNYQQVMLSGRELAYSQLPQEAKTWVNQRLKYTHGYGLVMSPVNQVTSDGLPELYIKDIPPVSKVNLQVSQPAIYYGEKTDNYIFTGTKTQEFDYPLGDGNAYTNYKGKGGVPIPTMWHRLAYAYDLGSLQILISNYFNQQSRIHYYRLLQERVSHVAPFLHLDSDPYLVVINGRLQWIVDGYTTSDRYPYSEPLAQTHKATEIFQGGNIEQILDRDINYIRNSLKVLIDACDDTMQFFVVDETDPVLRTYQKIFPHLFTPNSAIPSEVKAHFRYPQDLFKIQTQMYLVYHMNDPELFYNREDLWRLPTETYEGNEHIMQPYYMIMRLPGAAKEEFIQILPFTPANKDNMIAWMAARSNSKEYGKLLLYEFPKQKLIFGPRQIEARIDQEPQISQQFTLWSQAGSKVIRGDLLVIPIDQSLLYVEPVYLRAEQGELPELKRVIVAYDKAVLMEETLEESLAAIFGGVQEQKPVPSPVTGEVSNLAKSALATYQKTQEALRQGNWAEYGRYQQELEDILEKLNQGSKS
ncbi:MULTISPECIES: UPF0182 family membrane protein [Nostoc]|uniref:UPF0182 protein H6G92_28825 n=2 Tax=Nostoc TaxID=1177 RepID=A0ABR8IGS6_9NOSO|nr:MULTISPECIES: UPF0182 family protein [Nostoc]MBD2564354.1 UPF0182 family protein [Nostoc linckia FACHB-391]MBD2650142.1 UPF0182 family protein [Nostoc foliaceum FACHB-393]